MPLEPLCPDLLTWRMTAIVPEDFRDVIGKFLALRLAPYDTRSCGQSYQTTHSCPLKAVRSVQSPHGVSRDSEGV
jgi:hypothetical protein